MPPRLWLLVVLTVALAACAAAYSCTNHMAKFLKDDSKTDACLACVTPPSKARDKAKLQSHCVFDPHFSQIIEGKNHWGACKTTSSSYWLEERDSQKKKWTPDTTTRTKTGLQLASTPAGCAAVADMRQGKQMCFFEDLPDSGEFEREFVFLNCLLTNAAVQAAATAEYQAKLHETESVQDYLIKAHNAGEIPSIKASYNKFAELAQHDLHRKALRMWFICVHRKYANQAPLLGFLKRWQELITTMPELHDWTNLACPSPGNTEFFSQRYLSDLEAEGLLSREASADERRAFSFYWQPQSWGSLPFEAVTEVYTGSGDQDPLVPQSVVERVGLNKAQ